MVMGGGNNVESAYMSQVVGVGNTVKGNQAKNDKTNGLLIHLKQISRIMTLKSLHSTTTSTASRTN